MIRVRIPASAWSRGYSTWGYPSPYDAIEQVQPHGNPYEETHEGFLDVDSALEVLDSIRVTDAPREHALVPATVIDRPGSAFDPESYECPTSSLAEDVRVEGFVVRSDSRERRVKVVREGFEELNRDQFGTRPGDADSGAEYVVATYCTPARIRSQVRRMVVDEGREFGLHLNDDLHRRVVEDLWAENWQEMMEMDVEFTAAPVLSCLVLSCPVLSGQTAVPRHMSVAGSKVGKWVGGW